MANRNRTLDEKVYSIKDLEHYGSAKMEKSVREYYNEGAMDLITLHSNSSAYDRYVLRPRVLRNISNLDTSTRILGNTVKFPFGFSPTAMQTLAHLEGDIATSKACNASNVLMGLSNYSTIELEKVILGRENTPHVMQMSLLKNKAAMIQMIRRAEAAGFKALFVTLDCPYLGRRLNEFRNRFSVPKGMEFPNLFPGVDVTNLEDGDEKMAYDDTIEWPEIIPFFRQHTKMQIWAKGIYTSEDALHAIEHGFDGLIVSNHGGRQLDGVPSSLDVLREIAPVARGKIPIAIDGGIRRGTDIFKALALGADFCLAGRIALWGLAYNGQQGVQLALDLLYDEFKTCMALSGCRTVEDIRRECVTLLQPDGRLLKL
ncbi:FMN-dependent dehydrogenase [Aspergillus pseudoustus]|uniref:FMN-dependent dehydrogenase n=1 Tax=Aspergillus pseudoustus TaxID=1810923 RepID=A0ABR4JRM5_9EURO